MHRLSIIMFGDGAHEAGGLRGELSRGADSSAPPISNIVSVP